MEFGLKGTSRLVADVTGSQHSGLGFTVRFRVRVNPKTNSNQPRPRPESGP